MGGSEIRIEGAVRTTLGKGYCRRLRLAGKIPGNILDKAQSTSIELDAKLLSKAWKAGKIFTLEMGGESRAVKIHELQIDPVKRTAIHVDLMFV